MTLFKVAKGSMKRKVFKIVVHPQEVQKCACSSSSPRTSTTMTVEARSQNASNDNLNNPQEAERPLPKLTVGNVLGDIYSGIRALIYDPLSNRLVVPMIVALASIAGKVVILKVKYTEIDFTTYMQQIDLVNAGELDYSKIVGDTGPIVYPAGFVQVYQFLLWLADGGVNIRRVQFFFSYLFTFTVALSCVAYTMVQGILPWPLYLLLLSRRLILIYVLRLFNDCFTTCAMVGVVVILQQASYWYKSMGGFMVFLANAVAADLFSLAISIKMNALMYLPAFAIVSYFLLGENMVQFIAVLLVIPLVQLLVGWRFLLPLFWDDEASYIRWTYLTQAFNFSRKFLYKWTVNWKFVSEEVFLSDAFSNGLLVGHVSVLLIFVFTRFLSPKVTGKSVKMLISDALKPFRSTASADNLLLSQQNGPRLILLIFSSTNVIGVAFARSLHYQFLSWYCWQVPFLLYASGLNPFVSGGIYLAHEVCWNVFPATPASSAVLVSILSLILIAVWHNTDVWFKRVLATSVEKYDQ